MNAKSARGAETRRRILQVAAGLIYKNGVNGTSIDDVLKASATGKSQFYHYFGSKELLVRDVLNWHLEFMPSVQNELLSKLDSLAGIDAWLDQILTDYNNGLYQAGCPIGNLASEMASQNEALRINLEATFSHWESCLSRGLKFMRGAGQIRLEAEPEKLATFAVASIEGALLLVKTQKTDQPLKVSLAQLKRHLHGFAVGATRKAGPGTVARKRVAFTFCP